MNNEDFDRKMAFIVKQQAQFASDIQQPHGSQAQLQGSQARTELQLSIVILAAEMEVAHRIEDAIQQALGADLP